MPEQEESKIWRRISVGTVSYCRKSTKTVKSHAMRPCIVSYLDTEGIRHTVEVEAESLYEAAVLAVTIHSKVFAVVI